MDIHSNVKNHASRPCVILLCSKNHEEPFAIYKQRLHVCAAGYLAAAVLLVSLAPMFEKAVVRSVLKVVVAATMAEAIMAARRLYSIADAPDSSLKNFVKMFILCSFVFEHT